MPNGNFIVGTESGRFFQTDKEGLARINGARLTDRDHAFLLENGFGTIHGDLFGNLTFKLQSAARKAVAGPLDYLILVPTLRCNLACSYCQVSRADSEAQGFDWTPQILARVISLIDGLEANAIKIEFQGGEPSLRPDLIQAVIDACKRFEHAQFVICTNLSSLDPEFEKIIERPDVFVSTSLDGNAFVHQANRTQEPKATNSFFSNLRLLTQRYGPGKVSALPTIDQVRPPCPDSLIDTYLSYGISSIFLRPINYQGFARKRHPDSKKQTDQWWIYYDRFINRIVERNFQNRDAVIDETYLTLCLQRIFQIGNDRHVDLRNPNPVGQDYIVIDYDGMVYPTDEARMLTRSGVIDLAIGDIESGFDSDMRQMLHRHSTNYGDPACDSCVYQPCCGRDLIDDLSRYGRIDLPRHETAFCQKHLRIFDKCMEMIYSDDIAIQYSLAKWLRIEGDSLPVLPRMM